MSRKIVLFFLITLNIFNSKCQKKTHFDKKNIEFDKKNDLFAGKLPFFPGEKLEYKISYGVKKNKSGILLAAFAETCIKDTLFHNLPSFAITASGKTTRIFSLFMRVQHEYKSVVDKKKFKTLFFSFKVQEGKFNKIKKRNYNKNSNIEYNDILSAIYKLRKIDNSLLNKGDTIHYSYGKSKTKSTLTVLGRETIKTKFGKINTLKLSPTFPKNRRFKGGDDATIWISDDVSNTPVKMEIPLKVGVIYVNLNKYENTGFIF